MGLPDPRRQPTTPDCLPGNPGPDLPEMPPDPPVPGG